MRIGELCSRSVIVAERMESSAEVARLMVEHHVGSVVIVDKRNGRALPAGIITDRDLVKQVVARNRAAEATPVSQVMSSELLCAPEDQDVYDVLQQMRARGVRRCPVVDAEGALVGIFTFDDMVEWTSAQLAALTGLMQREQRHERE